MRAAKTLMIAYCPDGAPTQQRPITNEEASAITSDVVE